MIKILLFSSLFPNSQQPSHGIFVENRLRKLLSSGEVEVKIVAPVPWFPFKSEIFGIYGKYARVPFTEERYGNSIMHPRYMVIPKIGMNWTPHALVKSALPIIKNIIQDGYDFDLIDAHYFYPDGVAASMIGEELGKPVVITARGSDINLLPQFERPRKMIKSSAERASAMITVSKALKDTLCSLDVDGEKITVLRNGVDLEFFTPATSKNKLKDELGLSGTIILSVGNLVELKGHHLIIDALKHVSDVKLYIIGGGNMRQSLEQQVLQNGLQDRVVFTGVIDQEKLRKYYQVADALVLASSREGWANVLLESMACGTPVVASNVGGTPEVVSSCEAGVIMESRDVKGVVSGISKLLNNYPSSSETRGYAENFSWDYTTNGQLKLFKALIAPE